MKLYAKTLEGNTKGDTFHFVYLHRKIILVKLVMETLFVYQVIMEGTLDMDI